MKNEEYYLDRFNELFKMLYKAYIDKDYYISNILKDVDAHYHQILIPKRNGELRTISIPDDELKDLQNRIREFIERAIFLKDKSIVNIGKKYRIGSSSYGFEKNKSIITNAKVHRNGKYFLKVDISKFFCSINFYSVYFTLGAILEENTNSFYLFYKSERAKNKNMKKYFNKLIGYKKFLRWVRPGKSNFTNYMLFTMTNLLCQNGSLATGSPASPSLSNYFMRNFDLKMESFLWKDSKQTGAKYKYTRYADDITISSNKKIHLDVLDYLKVALNNKKLSINQEKTHFQSYRSKNVITGINVTKDGQLTVGKHKKLAIKKMLYTISNSEKYKDIDSESYLRKTLGNLSYLYSVEPEYTKKMIMKYKNSLHNHSEEVISFFDEVTNIFINKKVA